MSGDHPFQLLFETFGKLSVAHAETVNLKPREKMRELLAVDVKKPGHCILLKAPRAGHGKTHLLTRLQHDLGGKSEFIPLHAIGGSRIDAMTVLDDTLRRLVRGLPAAGGLTVLDLVSRRLFSTALQPLVKSGEVPCQDREGALSALRTRPIETFDFHHPTAVTAHWARDNFGLLSPRLAQELAEDNGLSVTQVAFWLNAMFRFAATAVDEPSRASTLNDAVFDNGSAEVVSFERLIALLGLMTSLMRVVLVADEVEGLSTDEHSALKFASFIGSLRQSVDRLDVILSINQDVWENAFIPRMSGGLADRLSEVVVELEPLDREAMIAILDSRSPGSGEKLFQEIESGDNPDYARGIIKQAAKAWQEKRKDEMLSIGEVLPVAIAINAEQPVKSDTDEWGDVADDPAPVSLNDVVKVDSQPDEQEDAAMGQVEEVPPANVESAEVVPGFYQPTTFSPEAAIAAFTSAPGLAAQEESISEPSAPESFSFEPTSPEPVTPEPVEVEPEPVSTPEPLVQQESEPEVIQAAEVESEWSQPKVVWPSPDLEQPEAATAVPVPTAPMSEAEAPPEPAPIETPSTPAASAASFYQEAPEPAKETVSVFQAEPERYVPAQILQEAPDQNPPEPEAPLSEAPPFQAAPDQPSVPTIQAASPTPPFRAAPEEEREQDQPTQPPAVAPSFQASPEQAPLESVLPPAQTPPPTEQAPVARSFQADPVQTFAQRPAENVFQPASIQPPPQAALQPAPQQALQPTPQPVFQPAAQPQQTVSEPTPPPTPEPTPAPASQATPPPPPTQVEDDGSGDATDRVDDLLKQFRERYGKS